VPDYACKDHAGYAAATTHVLPACRYACSSRAVPVPTARLNARRVAKVGGEGLAQSSCCGCIPAGRQAGRMSAEQFKQLKLRLPAMPFVLQMVKQPFIAAVSKEMMDFKKRCVCVGGGGGVQGGRAVVCSGFMHQTVTLPTCTRQTQPPPVSAVAPAYPETQRSLPCSSYLPQPPSSWHPLLQEQHVRAACA
jgi:hypothetical protein